MQKAEITNKPFLRQTQNGQMDRQTTGLIGPSVRRGSNKIYEKTKPLHKQRVNDFFFGWKWYARYFLYKYIKLLRVFKIYFSALCKHKNISKNSVWCKYKKYFRNMCFW